jgi:hypothetical protein
MLGSEGSSELESKRLSVEGTVEDDMKEAANTVINVI